MRQTMSRHSIFNSRRDRGGSAALGAAAPLCRDLVRLAKDFLKGRMPGQLVAQVTTACEAECQQCAYGRRNSHKKTLREEKVLEIIDAAAMNAFQAISFTGGEPFLLYNRLLRYIRHARNAGIEFIRTGTNAGFLQRPYKRFGRSPAFLDAVSKVADDIASTPLRNLWISVDSADVATHEANRNLAGVISAISLSVPLFADREIFPAINLGINRLIDGPCPDWEKDGYIKPDEFRPDLFEERYRNGFEKYFRLCEELGFTIVGVCYPMGEKTGMYGAASETLTSYSPQELSLIFKALDDVSRRFRSRLRISSPSIALYFLKEGAAAVPCSGGHDYFFISAEDGLAYPCGYLSEPLGEFKNLDFNRLRREKRTCKKCHWECFFDLDQLLGSLRSLIAHPLTYFPRLLRDQELRERLFFDVKYFLACDFLDGRRPPNYKKLSRFASL